MKYRILIISFLLLSLSATFGQEYTENQPNTETTEANWEDIHVTEDTREVSHLKKIERISKRSGWHTTNTSRIGYDSALRLLKIAAARKNCTTILLIHDSSKDRPNKVKGTRLTAVLYR